MLITALMVLSLCCRHIAGRIAAPLPAKPGAKAAAKMPCNRAGEPCPITRNGGVDRMPPCIGRRHRLAEMKPHGGINVTIGGKGKAAINPQADGWPQNHQAVA